MFNVDLKSFVPSRRGSNGVFEGRGTDSLSNAGNDADIRVVNDVQSYTQAQLAAQYGSPVSAMTLEGWAWVGTFPRHYTPYENYSASNLSGDWLSNQIHELGHSLKSITGVKTPPKTEYSDDGDKLVECFNRKRRGDE